MLRNVKGYKKPLVAPGEGEPAAVDISPNRPQRDSILPEMQDVQTELITKDEVD